MIAGGLACLSEGLQENSTLTFITGFVKHILQLNLLSHLENISIKTTIRNYGMEQKF